jgi:pyruvate kinase
MRRHRNAKIIATLGPASSSPEIVRSLFDAGADVFRLNFSHGTHEDHKKRYDLIRSIEKDVGRPIGVLVDLQGPKLRLGTFGTGRVILPTGAQFLLDLAGGPGDKERVTPSEVFQALSCCAVCRRRQGPIEVEACKPAKQ